MENLTPWSELGKGSAPFLKLEYSYSTIDILTFFNDWDPLKAARSCIIFSLSSRCKLHTRELLFFSDESDSAVQYTAESRQAVSFLYRCALPTMESDSAVQYTAESRQAVSFLYRCALPTMESDSAVSRTVHRGVKTDCVLSISLCSAYNGVWLRCDLHTAKSYSSDWLCTIEEG